ncbi:hypothetical protein AVEN_175545-1 [Araneus ventricosus]|uniref:Uncharacterized protein n=1 Tax=Araneus ventricosus TaxID=182803 RepID=A0A4Y2CPL5_ARAVE|nr:hypothetical protein AVEN_175545-1 [Araneus ventricosus]
MWTFLMAFNPQNPHDIYPKFINFITVLSAQTFSDATTLKVRMNLRNSRTFNDKLVRRCRRGFWFDARSSRISLGEPSFIGFSANTKGVVRRSPQIFIEPAWLNPQIKANFKALPNTPPLHWRLTSND